MKILARCALPAALAIALAALPARAQQNPGLATRPSGFSVDETNAPAEQSIDLTRPNPQTAIDSTSGEELYFDAAMRGEAWAQTKLGKAYLEQSDNPERQQKGIELLKKAAAQKDAEALYVLATFSATVAASQPSGMDVAGKLKEAAELGSAEAQYEMAVMLMNGDESARNEVLGWARKAANQGHAKAQHFAAIALLRRASTPEEVSEGVELLEKAAAQNHREALMVYAGILTRGEFGLAKDQKRAEQLLLPRAKEGDLEFQFGLATLYLYGDQFTEAKDTGMSWLRRSADSGYDKSRELLAKITRETTTPAQ